MLQGVPDLSLLAFPHLHHLRLRNYPFKSLSLQSAYYPQLRKLVVQRSRQPTATQKLQLQLPHLLTLELESVKLKNSAILEACLCVSACPRLRRFLAFNLMFEPNGWEHRLVVDMPWMQEFELEETDIGALELRAPRLMDLSLTSCGELAYVELLEDERIFNEEYDSDVEYAAALASPDSTLDKEIEGLRWWEKVESGEDAAVARRCVPFALNRVYLTACNVGFWKTTNSYEVLVRDPRVRAVDDSEDDGEDESGSHELAEFEGAEMDEYVPKRPFWFLFEDQKSDE